MEKRLTKIFSAIILMNLLLTACLPGRMRATATPVRTEVSGDKQPFQITGSFTYTNDIITTYYVEQAVALVDMHGFIIRDPEWEIPLASQTLGFLSLDPESKKGEYTLQLPAKPTGILADVDHNTQQDNGVQIFAVSYWPNLTGSPYSVGDDRDFGWPTYLASVITDTENEDEVIGGSLVVWAPDDRQQFPSGFGQDKRLFTADDPVNSIPAGYSIINLDKEPFTVTREEEPQLALYEPQDVQIKDFSQNSYSQAFDRMFEIVKKEYAFNGITGKQPDWDALYEGLKPRVEEAEKKKDAAAFYLALRDFTWAFNDGHVNLDGGNAGSQVFLNETGGGYGFAIRELDDGKVIVIYVLENGPAAEAGIQVGAEVLEFNGKPVKQAIGEVKPLSLPHSTDFSLRYQQARYFLRAPEGTEAPVTFSNPAGNAATATLKASSERQSFNVTSIYSGFDQNALPVEFRIMASGTGYIKINTNYDDLNLIIRLFERALKTFQENQLPGIIIDLRQNAGGAPLGLAGFLYDKEIILGQLEYYSEKTGKFEPEGVPEKVLPNQEQYQFEKMVLLVGQACASACEIEAYGFSQVPGMIVVGETPSAGVEAEVARGQFLLPEGMSLQVPTGRFTLPDGSIFLEGKGVIPTLLVPIDEAMVLSQQDEVLKAGEAAVLKPMGMGITPTGPPKVAIKEDAQKALESGNISQLEEKAREQYSQSDLSVMDKTFSYTIELFTPEDLLWAWGWCAGTEETLAENLKYVQPSFLLGGQEIDLDRFASLDYPASGQFCRAYYTILSDWPAGEHHLSTTVTFTRQINDGSVDYTPGSQVFEYIVYVKP